MYRLWVTKYQTFFPGRIRKLSVQSKPMLELKQILKTDLLVLYMAWLNWRFLPDMAGELCLPRVHSVEAFPAQRFCVLYWFIWNQSLHLLHTFQLFRKTHFLMDYLDWSSMTAREGSFQKLLCERAVDRNLETSSIPKCHILNTTWCLEMVLSMFVFPF